MTDGLVYEWDAAATAAAFSSLRRRLADQAEAWREVGAQTIDVMDPYVPVASGALVDSIRVQAATGIGVDVGSDLIYAGVQDQGWPAHNIAAHHFTDRGAEALPEIAVQELEPAIQRDIDAVGLR